MSGNQPLEPSRSYDWRMTIQGPIGGGRMAQQEHWGLYHVPPGHTATGADAMEQLRQECAQKMNIPVHAAVVVEFRLSA
jgi:hypothetical protein